MTPFELIVIIFLAWSLAGMGSLIAEDSYQESLNWPKVEPPTEKEFREMRMKQVKWLGVNPDGFIAKSILRS